VTVVRFGVVTAVFLSATLNAQHARFIVSVTCGQDRQVHLTFKGGKEVAVPWLQEQSGCDGVKIAPDHLSAGWLILQSGAVTGGTSPVATGVTVFSANRSVRHYGDGLAVWDWRFHGNRLVALSTNTAHGPQTNNPHYLLYDVSSGKLLRKWDGIAGTTPPRWAAGLRY
jgi:hypothetical protein